MAKGSRYTMQLWDWGNWTNNIALRQIALHQGKQEALFAYERGFWAPYGVRSLSKYEKMYRLISSSNPSSWNLLAMNTLAYFEGDEVIEEFL